MSYDSLRPYLDVLEKKGLFRWITVEVDKDWEIASIGRMIFRGLREERRFPSVDALVAQIRDDLATGAARLGALEGP